MLSKYILTVITVFALFISGCNSGGDISQAEGGEEVTPTTSMDTDMVVKVDSNTIEVYWKFDKNVESYTLEFGTKDDGFYDNIVLDQRTTNYKVSNLQEDCIYIFKLVSLFNDGTKSESQVIEAKTATINQLIQSDSGSKI